MKASRQSSQNGAGRKDRVSNQTTFKLSKSLSRLLRREADRRGMRVYDYTCVLLAEALQKSSEQTVVDIRGWK